MKRNSSLTDGCPRLSGEAAEIQFFHLGGIGTLVPCSFVPVNMIVCT